MPTRTLAPAALLALTLVPLLARADPPEDIALDVDGLRSDRGEVRAALYASSDGWTAEGRELASCHAAIVHHRAHCVFAGIAPGTYAIAMLHDEDDDGRMNRDLFGFPQEGFAFSNDAAPGLGPPSFESAHFTHGHDATALHVRARYGL
jgi:uncharacterized protein (DUF2141 family)